MNYKSVAVDGPAGAGKTTLSKALAQELGFLYVDTGAIYRTVGLYVRRNHAEPVEAEVIPLLDTIQIDQKHCDDGLQHMYLMGEDVTSAIRENEISHYASAVSAIPAVRAFLLEQQRDFARTRDVVMDGRDIGTVVLPDADVKIFLTASPEARAKRRWLELQESGQNAELEEILRQVNERDLRDTTRASAPLRQAEDAILLDTTEMNREESLAAMIRIVKEKLAE